MAARWFVVSVVAAAMGAAGGAAVAQPASPGEAVIELNRQAVESFGQKQLGKAQELLIQAIKTATDAGLASDAIMARTYLHLGAVLAEGKDKERAVEAMRRALAIKPDIGITRGLGTPAVREALAAAKQAPTPGAPAKPAPAPAPTPPPPPVPTVPRAPAPAPAPPAPGARDAGDEPDLPATIPQPLYCPTPDDAPPGRALILRCVPQPGLAVARVLLFFRKPNEEEFTPSPTLKSRKGWYRGAIPAEAVTGKMVQYYFEARGPSDDVVATAGRVDSPNLTMVRVGATRATGALAGTRIARGAAAEVAEDPLERLRRQRLEEARLAAQHRRGPMTFYVGLAGGLGQGWHPGGRLLDARGSGELPDEARLEAGKAGLKPAKSFHLAPEVGFQVTEAWAVALQLRYQRIGAAGSGNAFPEAPPKTSAFAALLKAVHSFGDGNLRPFASGVAGAGTAFLLFVAPFKGPDDNSSLQVHDTITGGPFVFGGGGGLAYHFTRHVAAVGELQALVGAPDLAAVVDLQIGVQVAF